MHPHRGLTPTGPMRFFGLSRPVEDHGEYSCIVRGEQVCLSAPLRLLQPPQGHVMEMEHTIVVQVFREVFVWIK